MRALCKSTSGVKSQESVYKVGIYYDFFLKTLRYAITIRQRPRFGKMGHQEDAHDASIPIRLL